MPRSRRSATRHGWIVLDKPRGWTSHDVVARVRRIVGERRVGHAGTLDPAATGVLPVAVGLATRTVEYLSDADKAYRAWITFGITTDSADREGVVTMETDPSHLAMEVLAPLLDQFRGEIVQQPPMHSAIKVDGRRLYELARKGEHVVVPSRRVRIHAVTVVDWDSPVLCIDVTCSKGTYIRSLARDLGAAAGTGAHLSRLVRTRSGTFTLDDAMSLDQLERSMGTDGWETIAYPADRVLEHLPAMSLDHDLARDWSHGKPVMASLADVPVSPVRAYNAAGAWLGVGEWNPDTGMVRPVKVIAAG